MATVPHEAVLHPFAPAARANPHAAYRLLRERDPVHFDAGSGSWFLSRYADVAAALRDPRFSAALGQRQRTRDDPLPPSMLTTDPPEHTRLRAPGALLFGPAAVRGLEPELSAEVDRLLVGLSGRPRVEAREEIGEPLAQAVFAVLLRLPAGERALFAGLARDASANLDPLAPPAVAAAGRRAMGVVTRYLDGHLTRLAETGDESALSRFAKQAKLRRPELLGVLNLAVVGGYQPIAEFTANALAVLAPVWGTVTDTAAAVDEVLRLEPPIPFTARVTTSAVSLDGRVIPAGSRVLMLLAAANRDPAVFAEPDALRLDRTPNPHLGFGAGAHLCLAAPLVRATGRILLDALHRRYPGLCGERTEPEWAPTLVPRRVTELWLHLS